MGGNTKAVNGGRIRRVTITEINEDKEWNCPIDDVAEEIEVDIIEKTTDEVFAALDDVVTDWKIKLEVVVGDGLKKIKRTSREKKAMMKYLPGDGVQAGSEVLVKAKKEIIDDWKNEVARAVKDTHSKLNDLGNAKIKDAVSASDAILNKAGMKIEKKSEKPSKEIVQGTFMDLKKLMRELDAIYQTYNADPMHFNKVRHRIYQHNYLFYA